jgi:hypothetical protein
MKKYLGKHGAGFIQKNNTVIMIISILTVTLIIISGIQPALASSISNSNYRPATIEEECLTCIITEPTKKDPPCRTCGCAVNHAVTYMINFVNDTMKDNKFPLWRAEIVGMVFEGLVLGFIDSGFRININANTLKAHINYWVDRLIEPENYRYNVTEILANIYAVGIGITSYLLTLCENNIALNFPAFSHKKSVIIKILSLFNKLIKIK